MNKPAELYFRNPGNTIYCHKLKAIFPVFGKGEHMQRRAFMKAAGTSLLTVPFISSCAGESGGTGMASPEERRTYLTHMLKELCTDLGPRPIGSPAYDRSVEIVRRELSLAFPAVELDTFTFPCWQLLDEPEFTVGGVRVECRPSHGSGGTPPEGITGVLKKSEQPRVVYHVVNPAGEPIAHIAVSESWVKGKAVPRPYHYYYPEPGGIPVINVGTPDAPLLEQALAQKAPVGLRYQARIIPDTPTSSVIGTLPGQSAEELLLFAHLDTVYCSPGAHDNTASLIMLLMLAHAFAGKKMRKTLTIVATSAEEYGYLGTKSLAARWRESGRLDNLRFVANFDSVTWGPELLVMTRDEPLKAMIRTIETELGLPGTRTFRDMDGLDREAKPFKDAGLVCPGMVVDANAEDDLKTICWHRPEDTPDRVPPETVETTFLLFREMINRLQTV